MDGQSFTVRIDKKTTCLATTAASQRRVVGLDRQRNGFLHSDIAAEPKKRNNGYLTWANSPKSPTSPRQELCAPEQEHINTPLTLLDSGHTPKCPAR